MGGEVGIETAAGDSVTAVEMGGFVGFGVAVSVSKVGKSSLARQFSVMKSLQLREGVLNSFML